MACHMHSVGKDIDARWSITVYARVQVIPIEIVTARTRKVIANFAILAGSVLACLGSRWSAGVLAILSNRVAC